jgi:hypothetical protein
VKRCTQGHANTPTPDQRRALPPLLRTGWLVHRDCVTRAVPAPGFIALASGAGAPIASSCVQLLLLYAVAYSLLSARQLHESTGRVAVQLLLHLLLPCWLFVQTATAVGSIHAMGIELQALQPALLASAVIVASNSLATAAAAVLEGRVPWVNRALASLPWQRPSPAAVIASTAAAAFGNPAAAPALMPPGAAAASGFDADTTLLRLACVSSPWALGSTGMHLHAMRLPPCVRLLAVLAAERAAAAAPGAGEL